MLKIPDSYFEDEVRDGYYVNGMMKHAWAAQMQILEDVDELCTRHGIRYMADWGTMLGTVRHGGYVPWDDDLDIGMPREDYRKFLEVFDELGGNYHVINYFTQREYPELFSRVVNHHGICLDMEHINRFHGFPFALGIDVFPYDYIYRDEEREKNRETRVQSVYQLIEILKTEKRITRDARDVIRDIQKMSGRAVLESEDPVGELILYLDEVLGECPESESDYMADYQNFMLLRARNYKLPKDVFDNLVAMDYEMIKVPVPGNFEEILRIKYRDFMIIRQNWLIHDYPYYESQLNILREHKPDYFPRYKFDKNDLPDLRDETGTEAAGSGKKRDILFLPFKAEYWNSMKFAWEEAVRDPDCNVYVMPIPYYYKEWDGKHGRLNYELNLFPEEVNAIKFDGYDLENGHPDVIYFQNPQDDYGETVSVHPLFYSDLLRKRTDKLVFIAPLQPDAPTPNNEKAIKSMDYFVTMPGVIRADEVYVGSDKLREAYIRKLTEFCGADHGFENKIRVAPNPSPDKVYGDPLSPYDYKKMAPDEWQDKLKRPNGSYKRVMLYELDSSAMITNGEKMIEKIRHILEVFKENSDDVCMLWRLVPDLESVCGLLSEELQGEFLDILEGFVNEGWGIFDASPDKDFARGIADAYYGDITSEVRCFVRSGKPVMIENPDL